MSRYGLTVIVCLLVAGGLVAGQTGASRLATIGASSTAGLPGSAASDRLGSLESRIKGTLDNDVGVSWILPMPDIYIPFGDTLFPRCVVENLGTQPETNVPVICVVYDTAAGARAYGPETVYVASLDPLTADTVEFPGWVPPAEEKAYFDTMATVLPGDQDTANDWSAGRVTVSDWGVGHLSYNDGTFEYAITWVSSGNELTEMFTAPERPLTLEKAALWISSFSGLDYDAEVRVYGNDGSPYGYPGTQLGAWVGQLQTDTWPMFNRNEVYFDPPIVVDYDTFFVSYYQTSVTPAYPYLALDTIGNTGHWRMWGRGQGIWTPPDSVRDPDYDYGIDAFYDAPLLDGSVKDISVPQGQIDSNTTFTPQVVVKNAGLCDRNNIAVEFVITSLADGGNTIYDGIANSGSIQAGQTRVVTFANSVTPAPGYYTMTSITLLPYDARPHNDTLEKFLAVGRPGIAAERTADGQASLTIGPNPLRRLTVVRYTLPKAGPATLALFDVTGRGVLTQTLAAGRTGTASLDVRGLKNGVYMVKVEAEGFSTTRKLVVQH